MEQESGGLPNGTVLHGRYTIIRTISSGGFGNVYLARDKTFDINIAIKEAFYNDENSRKQFDFEAQVLIHINNKDVVRGFETFEERGRFYLVMQYIEGPNLEELQIKYFKEQRHPIPESVVLSIMSTICSAVQSLHDGHIIHRDIKPANIKLNEQGEPILLDLGLAKLFHDPESVTLIAARAYTPGYAPPEQVEEDGTTNELTDIYALGATTYYALTGRQPWEAIKRLSEIQLGHTDLPPPSAWLPSIKSSTDKVIMQALDLDPAKRYISATALKHAIDEAKRQLENSESTDAKCLLCGTLNNPNNEFCDACGTPFPKSLIYGTSESWNSSLLKGSDTIPLGSTVHKFDDSVKKADNSSQVGQIEKSVHQQQNILIYDQTINTREIVHEIQWSPNGNLIATGEDNAMLRVWDVQTTTQLQKFMGHQGSIRSITWSPDGLLIASGSSDSTIRIWDVRSGNEKSILKGHTGWVNCVAWSPDGLLIASGSGDSTVRIWDAQLGKANKVFLEDSKGILKLAWSRDGRFLATGSVDGAVRLWDIRNEKIVYTLTGHTAPVKDVIWSANGSQLISSGSDSTIRVWDSKLGQEKRRLEGHVGIVNSLSLSSDESILTSQSIGNNSELYFWSTKSWQVKHIYKSIAGYNAADTIFHPTLNSIAIVSDSVLGLQIWKLDIDNLMKSAATLMIQYSNAKVVLIGDSGVGKSGLALVITKKPFIPTESTHGRHVWVIDEHVEQIHEWQREIREILLWDLAGQPGYRIVHQLYLNEVSMALIIFDGRNEVEPFSGVKYWDRAIRQVLHLQGNVSHPIKKFLISARNDRGGVGVSQERMNEIIADLQFNRYFETSAKTGKNIEELIQAIKEDIDWESLPKVTSSDLFQRIKSFLMSEKQFGRVLTTSEDLFRSFLLTHDVNEKEIELKPQFETCINLLESQDLIRKLSFGNLILLRPELLDAYTSALINSVKDEPDGLGSILESKVIKCEFQIPSEERLSDGEQEKILLIAMIEDLLHYELALREQAEDGQHLIFPSQATRIYPDIPVVENITIVLSFEGSIQNIYATLVVRLSHSSFFKKDKLWKEAITFSSRVGGECGIILSNSGEGKGEMSLFFNGQASEETRFHFEEYISDHLRRWAIPESIQRNRIYACPECHILLTSLMVQKRRELGQSWLKCPVCETVISLADREERFVDVPLPLTGILNDSANSERDRETIKTIIQGKREIHDYDAFLCYHGQDRKAVKQIAQQLLTRGFLPWLDEWDLQPGLPWLPILESQIEKIRAAVVFVGESSTGPWQNLEINALIRQFVQRNCPVIPVILNDCVAVPKLPLFLEDMTWVDFRQTDSNPMERLIWGITGSHFEP